MAQFLAQVNVEVINARYVTDLKAFLENADRYVKDKYGDNIFSENSSKNDVELDAETKRYKPKIAEGAANAGWVIEIRGWTYHKDGITFVKNTVLRNFQRLQKFAKETDLTKKNELKVEKYLKGVPDPLSDKNFSHPFLLSVRKVENPQPNQFVFINTSEMEGLLGASAVGFGGPGPGEGGPGGPGGPGVSPKSFGAPGGSPDGPMPGGPGGYGGFGTGAWTPISSTTTSTAGASGFGGMGPGEGGPGMVPSGPSAGPGGPGFAPPSGPPIAGGKSFGGGGSPDGPTMPVPGGGSFPQGGAGNTALAGKPKEKPRTEFVLCFIWREPTPTDPTPEAPAGGTTTGPGYPGG
jgi:hypothetical protein